MYVEMAVVDVTVAVIYLKHLNSSPVQFHCKMAQPYHISSLEIRLPYHKWSSEREHSNSPFLGTST